MFTAVCLCFLLGVHIIQRMYGCEWDDETNVVNSGFHQFGYDGEDFISFDLKTLTWIAPKQQGVITKHKWDKNTVLNDYWNNYHNQLCPEWLKKYVSYGRSSLQRTGNHLNFYAKCMNATILIIFISSLL